MTAVTENVSSRASTDLKAAVMNLMKPRSFTQLSREVEQLQWPCETEKRVKRARRQHFQQLLPPSLSPSASGSPRQDTELLKRKLLGQLLLR